MPVADLSQRPPTPLPQQLLESGEWLDLAHTLLAKPIHKFNWTILLSGLRGTERKGWFPLIEDGSKCDRPSHLSPPALLLMAILACGYDPHWPLRHKMCEGNRGLVSYIRAAVIGSQRSLVPLNYPLTQPGLLGLCGGALPAAPPNWCVPPGAFKPHKASCSWGVRLH